MHKYGLKQPLAVLSYLFYQSLGSRLIYTCAMRMMFGAPEVEHKLKHKKIHLDSFFTGGDFAHEAMKQINSAVRRRKPGASLECSLCFSSCLYH